MEQFAAFLDRGLGFRMLPLRHSLGNGAMAMAPFIVGAIALSGPARRLSCFTHARSLHLKHGLAM